MEAVGVGEARAWVELTEDNNFWIKNEKMSRKGKKGKNGSGGLF